MYECISELVWSLCVCVLVFFFLFKANDFKVMLMTLYSTRTVKTLWQSRTRRHCRYIGEYINMQQNAGTSNIRSYYIKCVHVMFIMLFSIRVTFVYHYIVISYYKCITRNIYPKIYYCHFTQNRQIFGLRNSNCN